MVHTPPYQPEGRRKIERFFKSCREQFLNSLNRKQMLSLDELNERLWDSYYRTGHSSLGTTLLLRRQRDIAHIRQPPPDLRRLFFHRLDWLVRRDCVFQLQNRFYEALPHLAGQTIEPALTLSMRRRRGDLFPGDPQGTRGAAAPLHGFCCNAQT